MIQLYLNWTAFKNAIAAGKTDCKIKFVSQCGLLAHTSPTFLKNCWIKKLSFACGLVFAANVLKTACFYTLFHVKHDS
jgi:hypothetical protein